MSDGDPGEPLAKRRKALEDDYFAKQNKRLALDLRLKQARQDAKEAIAATSGLDDDEVLERLVDLGIGSDTLGALSLVPLVEVAWADDRMEPDERTAALEAAEQAGVAPESPAHRLLEAWLAERPPPRLLAAWRGYVGALCEDMIPEKRLALRRDVLDRARAVAEAAGGFLGVGNRISRREREIFDILETSFGV